MPLRCGKFNRKFKKSGILNLLFIKIVANILLGENNENIQHLHLRCRWPRIIKTSIVMGEAAMKIGKSVVMSEIHGMAQRGGVVSTELRIGQSHGP